jgi:hypothetical protein
MGQDRMAREQRDVFRMREYEAVLSRIVDARTDVTRVETLYPLAIAAVYAWVFTNPPAIAALWTLALMIPVGIAFLGIVRLYSRRKHIALLEAYIRGFEAEAYGPDSDLGWERRYAKENPLRTMIWLRVLSALLILAGTIWVALSADSLFHQWQKEQVAQTRKP